MTAPENWQKVEYCCDTFHSDFGQAVHSRCIPESFDGNIEGLSGLLQLLTSREWDRGYLPHRYTTYLQGERMSVQGAGSGFAGVGYERAPDHINQDSLNAAGFNQAAQEIAGVADSPQESTGPQQVKDLIAGAFDSLGSGRQSSAPPSASSDQSANTIGQGLNGALAAFKEIPPPDGNGQMPQPTDTRPPGDTRSADQIVAGNPTLANLGNQDHVMDNLKKQCGDWTDPSLTPDQRADAAYRASEVLNYIKSSAASDGSTRSSNVTDDGRIDGFTKDGDARHGTEAGALKDFGEQGYGALSPTHTLDTTTDKYVNKDGTTKSTAQMVGDTLLTGFSDVEKFFSKVGSFIGDLHIPIISQIASAGSVAAETFGDEADVAKTAIDGGDVKQAQINAGIDEGETAAGSLSEIPGAKQEIKGAVDIGTRIAKQGTKKGAESAVDCSSSDSSDS